MVELVLAQALGAYHCATCPHERGTDLWIYKGRVLLHSVFALQCQKSFVASLSKTIFVAMTLNVAATNLSDCAEVFLGRRGEDLRSHSITLVILLSST